MRWASWVNKTGHPRPASPHAQDMPLPLEYQAFYNSSVLSGCYALENEACADTLFTGGYLQGKISKVSKVARDWLPRLYRCAAGLE